MTAFIRVLLISLIAGSNAAIAGTDFDIKNNHSENSNIVTPDFSQQHHQASDFEAHKHGVNFDLKDHNEQADSFKNANGFIKSASEDDTKIHQDANSSQISTSASNSFESEFKSGSGRPNFIPGHPNPFTPTRPNFIPGHPNPFTPTRPGFIPGLPNPFTPNRPSFIPGLPNPFTPDCGFGCIRPIPIIPINPGCLQISCINFNDISFQNIIKQLIDTKIVYIEQKSKTKESVVLGFEEILAKFKSILIQANKVKLEIQNKNINDILVILRRPEYQVVCQSLGLTQDILSTANASFIMDLFSRVQQSISSTARISFNEYLTRSSSFGFNCESIISNEFSQFERFVNSCSSTCNSPIIIGSKMI